VSGAVPESAFRSQTAYRIGGLESPTSVKGCGFMLKPNAPCEIDCVMKDYVAVYVLRGSGTYVDWNGKTHPLSAGCVAQRMPGRKHSTIQKPDGQWCEVFLHLDLRAFELLKAYGFIDPGRPVLHPGLNARLVEKFELLLSEISSGAGPVPFESFLLAQDILGDIYALDRAASSPSTHKSIVDEAKRLLGDDLTARIPLPELAARFNLSYERFRKVFRERTGFSPGAFRLRRRIESACRMLAERERSIKEAAFFLGYPDVQSFSKQFSQIVGVPPSEFRKRH